MSLLSDPSDGRPVSVAEEIDRIYTEHPAEVPGRIFRHNVDSATRSIVMRNVYFNSDANWMSAFVVMLALSAGVATLGLSQDSAATVIGSMIIAPLGAPILGLGGAIASAWPRQAFRLLAIVIAGAALVVAVAFVLGLLLPDGTPTAQVLARTNPDLRDLGVAVFAGAAGAYSLTRSSLSSSLVGVAIAVALVPPLGAVGLMLEDGKFELAKGALTLFGANFVGITIAGGTTLILTGFVPMPRLVKRTPALLAGMASVGALGVVVMIPLTSAYASAVDRSGSQTDAYTQAASTIANSGSSASIRSIDVAGNQVTIDVDDPTAVPAAAQFESDLADEIGSDVKVTIK